MCGCEIFIFASIVQSELNTWMLIKFNKLKYVAGKYASIIYGRLFIQGYAKYKK